MHAARLVIVLFIILAVVVAYNPQAREQAVKTWENIRPVVMEAASSFYVAIHDLITSHPPRDGTNEKPVPAGPGDSFERIVTMNHIGFVF